MEQKARGLQALERAEFLAEQGHPDLAEVLKKVQDEDTPTIVANLIAADLRRWAGNDDYPDMNVPSELYGEGNTLGWTIIEWCKSWSTGAGDPRESLEDIELEIDICLNGENE